MTHTNTYHTNTYAEACNAIIDDPASTPAIRDQTLFVQAGVAELLEALEAMLEYARFLETLALPYQNDEWNRKVDEADAIVNRARGQ